MKTLFLILFLCALAAAQGVVSFWPRNSGAASVGVIGTPTGTYATASQTVNSTLDAGQTGQYRYRYDQGLTNLPVLLFLHGWGDNQSVITDADLTRWAARGYFAASIQTRTIRNANGRELWDVFDIVNHIKANQVTRINVNRMGLVGYSNGGGTALGMAAKFPDLFELLVDYFGMSDFGFDPVFGWYQTNPSFASSIQTVLGNPASNQNLYRSRNALEAVTNYRGKLIAFHDLDDSLVAVSHSQRLNAAIPPAGWFAYYETTAVMATRATHGYPASSPGVQALESGFANTLPTLAKAIMPTAGTIRVLGFVKTASFQIFLGTGEAGAANVSYNTGTKLYQVTPLTGSTAVTIVQGASSVTQTISSTTTFTL